MKIKNSQRAGWEYQSYPGFKTEAQESHEGHTMLCNRHSVLHKKKAYLEGSKIDVTGHIGALCNMDPRSLGKGAGKHSKAQQKARDFEGVHGVLIAG